MSFRNNIKLLASGCWVGVAMAACSSDGSNEQAVQALRDFVVSPFQPAEEIRIPPGRPYIVLSYAGGRTPMSLISEENGIANYEGPGGLQMTLNNGLLARLRGLGQEYEALYTVESGSYRDNLINLARSKNKPAREVEYWIDQDPRRDRFICDINFGSSSSNLRKVVEYCKSIYTNLNFENEYFIDSQGRIVLSEQWLHPKALPVDIDHRRITP